MGHCAILYPNRYLDEHHCFRLPSNCLGVKRLWGLKEGMCIPRRRKVQLFLFLVCSRINRKLLAVFWQTNRTNLGSD